MATGVGVCLGWIPGEVSPRKLVGAPLADGTYEIEARPATGFWADCRGRKVATVVIDGGHCQAGLPAIQGLASTVAEGVTTITWRVAEELGGTFTFGLWFGPTSPVDTSGPPDLVLPYSPGQGDYQVTRLQTAPEFVAVAAGRGTEVGPVSELFLPWEAMGPDSPTNQVAMVGIEE